MRMEKRHPLAEYRATHGLTMAEFGALIGVDKGTISRWESGDRFPGREFWTRIREITGLGVDDLSNAMPVQDAAE